MLYHLDSLVIIDPGTGSVAWTRIDASRPTVDSGFGWIEDDTLVLVRDCCGESPDLSIDPAQLPVWTRTPYVCFTS